MRAGKRVGKCHSFFVFFVQRQFDGSRYSSVLGVQRCPLGRCSTNINTEIGNGLRAKSEHKALIIFGGKGLVVRTKIKNCLLVDY